MMDGQIINMAQYRDGVLFLTDMGSVYYGFYSEMDRAWTFERVLK